ncbi:hypothetical protein Bbelb_267190 [Branchiostoma belcheri]|nr:hypothetical protein Bbelb_267190 [Branchiostoma belcheri]
MASSGNPETDASDHAVTAPFQDGECVSGGQNSAVKIRLARRATSVLAGYVKLRQYLTMFLCVLWDLSAILCACHIPGGPGCVYSRRICLCVFLRDLSPIYETREHRTLT